MPLYRDWHSRHPDVRFDKAPSNAFEYLRQYPLKLQAQPNVILDITSVDGSKSGSTTAEILEIAAE